MNSEELITIVEVSILLALMPNTILKYVADPNKDFPKPIRKNGRNYWLKVEIEKYAKWMRLLNRHNINWRDV